MAKYRKKPVVIEAYQWNGKDFTVPFPTWLRRAVDDGVIAEHLEDRSKLVISTLEGKMEAGPNDWIIRGVKSELYPCKPDIFAATYEPAE